MKTLQKLLFGVFACLLIGLGPVVFGQTQEQAQPVQQERTQPTQQERTQPPAPPERVQAVQEVTATREIMALSYPEGTTISVKFQGTHRLPQASGEAKVGRKKGMTEIEIELDEMKPASFFGGDYNTYVLWTVSPEGHVVNVGEFILEGNRSKLNVSTPLETFGMMVTAEPHFLVSSPSRILALENTRSTKNTIPLQVSQIKYRGFEGVYNFERETLANMPEAKREVRPDWGQARTAVELAERAGAQQYAPDELAKAREALRKVEADVGAGVDKRVVMSQAHEVVRLAVAAQKQAEERAFQAALDAERKGHAEETSRLEKSMQEAQTEAERARLQAEQRELQLRMEERARQEALRQAEEAARRAAEAERQRREAEERARLAQQQAQQAESEAERLRREREEARSQMEQALSLVVETRRTARGLILNLPDILFEFNKATLQPQAREVLDKIAQILLKFQGYRLSIEGHTDSIGSDAYNQKLSEKRAQSVRNYLTKADIPLTVIEAAGFGESQPIASNTTGEGRQKNRRVEIVIQEPEQVRMIQERQ
ncbi:MAG: OmpA family protein [Acidobacteria bacterium]|nr:OmpA family protein [Acidobacteriota bacterium]